MLRYKHIACLVNFVPTTSPVRRVINQLSKRATDSKTGRPSFHSRRRKFLLSTPRSDCCGAHLASFPMNTEALFPVDKAAGSMMLPKIRTWSISGVVLKQYDHLSASYSDVILYFLSFCHYYYSIFRKRQNVASVRTYCLQINTEDRHKKKTVR